LKHKNNEGSSLLEIVIAMAILAVVVIPVCSSLILSHRMNAKTEAVLQAQLDVAAAVEYYMATGIPENARITGENGDYSVVEIQVDSPTAQTETVTEDIFPDVNVRIIKIGAIVRVEVEEPDGQFRYEYKYVEKDSLDADAGDKAICYRMVFSSESGKWTTDPEEPGKEVWVPDVVVETTIRAAAESETQTDQKSGENITEGN